MRRYETIFIAHPELSEEDHAALEKKLRSTIAFMKGEVIKLEDWGAKKLSYEIRKNSRGRYFLLDYLAAPGLVRELERHLRLNDQVLKFQTVKVSDTLNPEAVRTLMEAGSAEILPKAPEVPPPSAEPKKEGLEKATAEGGEDK